MRITQPKGNIRFPRAASFFSFIGIQMPTVFPKTNPLSTCARDTDAHGIRAVKVSRHADVYRAHRAGATADVCVLFEKAITSMNPLLPILYGLTGLIGLIVAIWPALRDMKTHVTRPAGSTIKSALLRLIYLALVGYGLYTGARAQHGAIVPATLVCLVAGSIAGLCLGAVIALIRRVHPLRPFRQEATRRNGPPASRHRGRPVRLCHRA